MARLPFRWNPRAQRYIAPTGRFVSQKAVRKVLDDALENAGKEIRRLADDLRAGRISLAEWQRGMRDALTARYTYSSAIAKGGWRQMSPSDWGRVGAEVRKQLGYLRNFAKEIERGAPLDGRFVRRAEMYVEASRGFYEEIRKRENQSRGFDEARRVLGIADHCEGCVDEASKGWVPIDEVAPIGSQECRTNCRCSIEYRNSKTGEIS